MPVNDKHPGYKLYESSWSKCRDAFAGSDAVKARGDVYLPKLTEQTPEEYKAYKLRALFYSITSKTVSALVGMSTTKPPKVVHPPEMDSYLGKEANLRFYEIWDNALTDMLLVGRIGGLVDAPPDGGDPYVSLYPTETILNWEVDAYDNFTRVVLHETFYEPSPTDEFAKVLKEQYRVLRLRNGVYTVQIYGQNQEPGVEVVPLFRGNTLDYIPFFVANPFGLGSGLVKPPMLDIVEINLAHYRSSADLEHGRHFTGLPTPVAIGVEATSKLHIGSMSAWVIPDSNGDAKYLEFTGQGLQSLENSLKEKQSQLASLSARMLDNSQRGSENAETVKMRYSSETASLSINVMSTQAFLNAIYRTIADMKGLGKDSVSITLSTDFLSGKLSGKEVKELVEAWMGGGMTTESLVYNLRRGEALSPDRSDAEEIAAMDKMREGKETSNADQV